MCGKYTLLLIVAVVVGIILLGIALVPSLHRGRAPSPISHPKALPATEAEQAEPDGVDSPPPVGPAGPPDTVAPGEPDAILTRPPIAMRPGPPVEMLPHPTSPALVDEAVKNLPWGNIAFTAPNSVRLESEYTIRLLLSQTISSDDLSDELAGHMPIEAARIQISNEMEAKLTGDGFRIQPITNELQTVGREGRTEWKWSVVAIRKGQQHLHLVLSAVIYLGDERKPHTVKTRHYVIAVNVTIGQRLKAFWAGYGKWGIAILLVPIARFLWKRQKRRQARTNYE